MILWIEVKDEDNHAVLQVVHGKTRKSCEARAKLLYGDYQELYLQTQFEWLKEMIK